MYNYEEQKERLFTDEGVRMLFRIKYNIADVIGSSGVVRINEITNKVGGTAWDHLACFDYLVELEWLKEISQSTAPIGQHRIFMKGRKS